MSDDRIGKLLAKVAWVCVEKCEYPEDGPSIEEITKVLEEHLGPLLRAGQAMHDARNARQLEDGEEAWRSAALATLEGRE